MSPSPTMSLIVNFTSGNPERNIAKIAFTPSSPPGAPGGAV